jgi:CO dehydrogenase/acetyl-CoA synthase delta subunit
MPGFSVGFPGIQYAFAVGVSGSRQRANSVLVSVAEVREGDTERAQSSHDQSVQQFLLRGNRN